MIVSSTYSCYHCLVPVFDLSSRFVASLRTVSRRHGRVQTPPDTVKPAFNEVNESRQDKERTINKAEERANREIPKARGVAAQSISEAEGYALERVNRAQGEATRFESILKEYLEAPQVTRRRLYLEAMTGLLADMKGLYIVDQDQKAMVPWLSMESGAQPSVQGGK